LSVLGCMGLDSSELYPESMVSETITIGVEVLYY
jgi:hypothetical protein